MQNEVGEASEPGGEGRGGSSTMPNKRNPIACSLTLAAAHRVPGLVASFLSAMVQEHERAVGGWQAEWPVVAGGRRVDRCCHRLDGGSGGRSFSRHGKDARQHREHKGLIFAERAMMLLGSKLGRDVAHKILEAAARTSTDEGRNLAAVLASIPK